jgi:hypothetical protein
MQSKPSARTRANYLERAVECERLADGAMTEENRNILLDLAARWRSFANETSSRLVRGTARGSTWLSRGQHMDETPQVLRDRIAHLLRLADGVTDRQIKDAIAEMIAELEYRLRELESKPGC